MAFEAFAPAKVNLFLHVGPLAADGYHPICSLIVFADVGDRLRLTPRGAPPFRIDGPFGAGLDADESNLVMRARQAILARAALGLPPFALTLTKRLPLAGGLGGGSSDAAAALVLIDRALSLRLGSDALAELAADLGADVPACLAGRPVVAKGRGQHLEAGPSLPVLDAVLINPGVASPTAEVFAAFDRVKPRTAPDDPPRAEVYETPREVADFLANCRNDLEAPAVARDGVIGETLSLLSRQPETLISRLSGSGATCFALCAGALEARTLADRLRALRPRWWITPCRLGGPWGPGGIADATTPP